ncbi:MAG: hypothetical protein JO339_08315 [Alphaproteobacteria bacterium]|nr:hypothetical protein [Alphaproteobacteria bacterium]
MTTLAGRESAERAGGLSWGYSSNSSTCILWHLRKQWFQQQALQASGSLATLQRLVPSQQAVDGPLLPVSALILLCTAAIYGSFCLFVAEHVPSREMTSAAEAGGACSHSNAGNEPISSTAATMTWPTSGPFKTVALGKILQLFQNYFTTSGIFNAITGQGRGRVPAGDGGRCARRFPCLPSQIL